MDMRGNNFHYSHFKHVLATKTPALFNRLKKLRRIESFLLRRTPILFNIFSLLSRKKSTSELLKESKKLELFDADWYTETYQLNFDSELDAFSDYVRKSKFAMVNPSENFDGQMYFVLHMDVYLAQQSPLIHYLLVKDFEKRQAVKQIEHWAPKEAVELPVTLDERTYELKIAICLHVFYEDYIQKFFNAISNFPVNIDLYITASSDVIKSKAETQFANHKKINRLTVKTVPNRGRNFGPLLVEFSDDLQDYDLFCHLHSKKSLYSGREQNQWSEYLIEYLINEESVTSRVLNAFVEDQQLGIYYPTTFWPMPAWVNHQTKNKKELDNLCESLGMNIDSDFFVYPVGGMFWARPKALKQLLTKNYQYDDFPAEPLPNDGSSLHALERVLGALAESNQYKQLFYYPNSGKFTHDQSFAYASYSNTAKGVLKLLQGMDSVSFDLFDTLVRREYMEPDYAKYKLGKILQKEGLVKSANYFVALRNNTEHELRQEQNFQGDVCINDIYLRLGKKLKFSEKQITYYCQLEFELDFEMIKPKSEIVQVFNDLDSTQQELYIITDTYYTKQQIAQIIKSVGLTSPHHLLVSNDIQHRKDNGTMWKFFCAKYKSKISNSAHIHIGDNVVSDCQIAGDHGLKTLHLLNPVDKWKAAGFPEVSFENKQGLDENVILKWGRLISNFGSNPFLGE